jgi:hypothetical protein
MRILFAFDSLLAAAAFAVPTMATADAYVFIETIPGAVVDANWGFAHHAVDVRAWSIVVKQY